MSTAALNAGRRPALGRAMAALSLVGAAASWGLATVMTKATLATLPPFTLLTIQLAGSITFLWVAVLLLRQSMRLDPGSRRAALSGLLEPGLAYAVAIPGLALTSAANASMIGAAEPVLVCAVAWLLLGERPRPVVLLAILAAMIGAALVTISGASSSEGPSPLVGNFLVLAGTLFAAVYVVLSSRYVAETAPLALAALQQSVGFIFALLLFAVTLLTGWERFPATIQPSSVLLALGSGVAQYALPFWLYLTGLSVLRTSTSALFLALIPVFGVGGAVLFLSESLHPQQLLGCAIVVIAVAVTARRGN
jgi:drug/metabolite transporter (DMT)-like permease